MAGSIHINHASTSSAPQNTSQRKEQTSQIAIDQLTNLFERISPLTSNASSSSSSQSTQDDEEIIPQTPAHRTLNTPGAPKRKRANSLLDVKHDPEAEKVFLENFKLADQKQKNPKKRKISAQS